MACLLSRSESIVVFPRALSGEGGGSKSLSFQQKKKRISLFSDRREAVEITSENKREKERVLVLPPTYPALPPLYLNTNTHTEIRNQSNASNEFCVTFPLSFGLPEDDDQGVPFSLSIFLNDWLLFPCEFGSRYKQN